MHSNFDVTSPSYHHSLSSPHKGQTSVAVTSIAHIDSPRRDDSTFQSQQTSSQHAHSMAMHLPTHGRRDVFLSPMTPREVQTPRNRGAQPMQRNTQTRQEESIDAPYMQQMDGDPSPYIHHADASHVAFAQQADQGYSVQPPPQEGAAHTQTQTQTENMIEPEVDVGLASTGGAVRRKRYACFVFLCTC
jgi:hypothetical protein